MATLLLISDSRVHRETLARALGELDPFTVLGTGRTGEEAIRKSVELDPDVVLLDLPRADGIATLRGLRSTRPELSVIALGLTNDQAEILAWAEAGAAGFTLKDGSLDDLQLAIESALRGELHCSPAIAATFVRRLQLLAGQRASGPYVALTPREREILSLVDKGLANKEISQRLGIEVATVKNHVHNILEKLRVSRRSEAAAKVAGRLRRTPYPRPPV